MELTVGERRWFIFGGVTALAVIAGFCAAALAALLLFDGAAAGSIFDAYTLKVLRFTLWQALLSALLSVLLGAPVALALARRPVFPGRVWVLRLLAVPMGLPVLIGALGLLGIWGRQGIANDILAGLGLSQPVSVYGLFGILLAHVFFNMPLAARLLLIGLERIPSEYWRVSASLGMSSFSVFRFVERPVILGLLPGVVGLIFMLCATSFTLVLVLGGGPSATTLEVAIFQALRFDFDPPRAVALCLMQLLMAGALLAVMARFPAPADHGMTHGGTVRRFDGWHVSSRLYDGAVIVLAVLFTALPLISVAVAGLAAHPWTLVAGAAFRRAAITSFSIAAVAATLALLLAVAMIRARQVVGLWPVFSSALGGAGSLVLVVSPLILGTGWFLILRPFGDVARFAPFLVVVINALMALPFVLRVLEPAFAVHAARSGRLAASLGIMGFNRLRLVDLPVLWRPLATGFSFAMALSLGDLGAVALFGSDDLVTLPYLIYSRMGSYRTTEADGFALILGLVCLALTVIGTLNAREVSHEK